MSVCMVSTISPLQSRQFLYDGDDEFCRLRAKPDRGHIYGRPEDTKFLIRDKLRSKIDTVKYFKALSQDWQPLLQDVMQSKRGRSVKQWFLCAMTIF